MRILDTERLTEVGNTAFDRVVAELDTYPEPWNCGLVRRPAAAAVLPYDLGEGVYWLVRQPRIGRLGAETIEAPAGVLDDPDDDPAATAARELQEEMGLRALWWTTVAAGVYVSPGYSDERMYLYLAEDLTPVAARPVDAYIDRVQLPLAGLADQLAAYRTDPRADLKTLTLLQALHTTVSV